MRQRTRVQEAGYSLGYLSTYILVSQARFKSSGQEAKRPGTTLLILIVRYLWGAELSFQYLGTKRFGRSFCEQLVAPQRWTVAKGIQ